MKMTRLVLLTLLAAVSASALPAWAEKRPPLPPPFLLPPLPDPKDLVPIPQSGAFYVPDVDAQLFFDNGYWWTTRDGHWYRSRHYREKFVPVLPGAVPPHFLHLRPDYRDHYRRERRIPYGEWRKKHWRDHRDRGRHRGRGYERDRDRRHDDRGRHRDRDRDGDRDRDRDRDDRGGRGHDRGR